MTVTALIVEDEPLLAKELRKNLQQLWPELAVAGIADTGPKALQMMQADPPDILFVDIQLPGMSGLEVADHAGPGTHVVFTTAFDQHAVAAFEQGAVDYVLKPIEIARLATTVARLRDRAGNALPGKAPAAPGGPQATGAQYTRWIRASVGNQLKFITTGEIVFFQSDAKFTRVVTVDASALIKKTIKELARELDPESFLQVGRGAIVNIAFVDVVERDLWGRVTVHLRNRPEKLPVSESFRGRFRQM